MSLTYVSVDENSYCTGQGGIYGFFLPINNACVFCESVCI